MQALFRSARSRAAVIGDKTPTLKADRCPRVDVPAMSGKESTPLDASGPSPLHAYSPTVFKFCTRGASALCGKNKIREFLRSHCLRCGNSAALTGASASSDSYPPRCARHRKIPFLFLRLGSLFQLCVLFALRC
jgi:hypothetical protein